MNVKAENVSDLLISPFTLRKVIGILGTSLPLILVLGGMILWGEGIQRSVSLYYHTGMRDVFVGMLCAIGLGLLSYRGYDIKDVIASNIGCVMAAGLAFFPTDPDPDTTTFIGYVHLTFAAAFFATLIYFSFFLFTKTAKGKKPTAQKIKRNKVYKSCAGIMAACIIAISIYYLLPEHLSDKIEPWKPVFFLESVAVMAFGVSWLTKGEAFLKDGY